MGSKAQIWAAVIAAVAAILVALIGTLNSSRGSSSGQGVDEAPSAARVVSSAPEPPPTVTLTAVLIGTADEGQAVTTVRTLFAESEPIAITVRYQASEDAANFPVRLGIDIGNPTFGDRQYTQVADISRPGRGEHTFVVRPDEKWNSSQQLLQVSLDDAEAYSKMITIE